MYPKNASRATEVMHQVVPYSSFIARLYLASLERTGMQIRQQVVENIAFAEDLNSLVEGFIPLLSGWLGVSDCRVWVHHPRRRQLYRVSAAAPTGQRKTLSLKDSRSPIVDCFETRTAVYLPGAAVDDEIANWAAIPIPLPEGTKLAGIPSKCAGVVELRDHVTRLGDVRETTSLSWEDRYVAHFAAELLAVLLYQAVRGADHDGEYDRNMHGAQTALQAARASLQLMERHLANPAFRAHSAENLLPNAIDWLRDLEMQVARDVLLARRPRPGERLALYGEVLAKIQPLASRLNTRSRSVTVRVHDIDQLARPDRFQRIPRVWADKEGLNMVFRNLIDNARKYGLTPGTKIADIRLAVDVSNEFVSVFFEDLGRGVEREERDLIFEDGYRGALAERRSTDGLGRGLFDCKRVLQSMGGELLLHGGTTGGAKFEVRLKRADRLNHERRTT
jgi:signal transduction histidine kinase